MLTLAQDFQRINGITWFCFSFLLMLAVYFRFTRFFSLRNWDLVALYLLVPGLLAIERSTRLLPLSPTERLSDSFVGVFLLRQFGYVSLFVVTGILMLRCLLDLALTRRPRLDANLNNSGMMVLSLCFLAFMMFEAYHKPVPGQVFAANREAGPKDPKKAETAAAPLNPVTPIFMYPLKMFVKEVAGQLADDPHLSRQAVETATMRSFSILSHWLTLLALLLIGRRHFDGINTGMSMAMLYLMLPTTAIHVEKVDHVLPAMGLLWAVCAYRRPLVAGILFGLASWFIFPLFLLPLWVGFYWRRGASYFITGALATTALGAAAFAYFAPSAFEDFLQTTAPWRAWRLYETPGDLGFWTESTQVFRLPIFVVYVAGALATAFWPVRKTLADLMALSAVLILGTQFFYADQGGIFVNWYLPMVLLVIFRNSLPQAVPPTS